MDRLFDWHVDGADRDVDRFFFMDGAGFRSGCAMFCGFQARNRNRSASFLLIVAGRRPGSSH
jgi:hypothetical protein